ncbi:hypothetical protein GW943_00410 [Candidatus Parcubacteria bacterium]|uniref:Uncharacterized protein n=1 Tax=Candidatus Kaiserbacteria bacterium CG10_big_fil_rev_8_21_14_0_10_47_16 TaxID=1974608 RepID=A0A2H0UD07_9BACT|nr:hypothetical protein [Candidatus Parcubacteria bacterium]PIR84308.1 MAG: hypothetical protein COU16_01795 [Candidatus Kaiserbacteria bacterium CG10_big_fil_rev_8_21_14_0_10_47_16]
MEFLQSQVPLIACVVIIILGAAFFLGCLAFLSDNIFVFTLRFTFFVVLAAVAVLIVYHSDESVSTSIRAELKRLTS